MYSQRNKPPGRAGGPRSEPERHVDLLKMNIVHELSEEELEKLYMWVDEIPLSRPKRNMTRDFSDGVLMAEILKHKLKSGVEMHNYPACNNINGKESNWKLLNRKVLCRMDIEISDDLVKAICACKPHVIESVLCALRDRVDLHLANQMRRPARRRDMPNHMVDGLPEADQDSRGYVPSAEGFYNDGPYQTPPTRRMYPEYAVNEPQPYISSPVKQPTSHRSNHGNGEMLPKALLDEREVAIEGREQTIQMLQAKITRLEQLLTLKDLRIDDLSQKLDQLTTPFQQPSQRGPGGSGRGPGMSNRLVNQPRGQPRHQVATHGGRY